jgi:hypothetical protein
VSAVASDELLFLFKDLFNKLLMLGAKLVGVSRKLHLQSLNCGDGIV